MDDLRQRVTSFVKALPAAHKVGIFTAVVALAMLTVVFLRWVTTPTYTVLYSGMDPKSVAGAIDELETEGVPYRLEGGGSTILVPRERLYTTRAAMAGKGFSGTAVPEGYDLLSDQGLSVSDFRQRVDYQRALEGEIAKTLMAMDAVDSATVHLVLPEEELFAERAEPVTASVLLAPARPLTQGEVETVSFLVSSSVEGLTVNSVTIADTKGTVLHAPGDAGGASVATNRNIRQTREFEQALATDVTALLERVAPGGPASVVVRASLNFDESETETETYAPEGGVALKEQTTNETFEGAGQLPQGAVGVDGGPQAGEGTDSNYAREEALREYGVDRTSSRTTAAPGSIEKLSVAIVMDDGSVTGAREPDVGEVETLVSAALGLEPDRGDTVAVSAIPFAEPEEAREEPEASPITDLLATVVGAVVLLLVALALFLMTRRRRKPEPGKELELASAMVVDVVADGPAEEAEEEPLTEQLPRVPAPALVGASTQLKDEVTDLVARQPEEIATLLRSWLADRRG